MSLILNDEIIYESEHGYKIAKSSGSLYILLPEDLRYTESKRAYRDGAFDSLGIRALNISNGFLNSEDLKTIVEGMKAFVDNDDYIRNFIKPYGNMAETNGDNGVMYHIINSDYTPLTKFALVFSTSAMCREYTPEIIDQIVKTNGNAEDHPDFNLSTIESYATPFFPIVVNHDKGNKTPSANINNLIAYANFLNEVEGTHFTNASNKLNDKQFVDLLFTLGRRGKVLRTQPINVNIKPSQLRLLRFFSGNFNDAWHRQSQSQVIPDGVLNFINENDREENLKLDREYAFLTDEEYTILKNSNSKYNSTALQYTLAKYKNVHIAIDIDETLRSSQHSNYFIVSNNKTIIAIDDYIEETQGDIPFEIWLSLHNLRIISCQVVDAPVEF